MAGLRYLESFELSLVRESLHERELLLRIAPQLVHRQPFLIPVYPTTTRRPWELNVGLTLYWLLAGMRNHTFYSRVPKKEWTKLDGLATTRATEGVSILGCTNGRSATDPSGHAVGGITRCSTSLSGRVFSEPMYERITAKFNLRISSKRTR